MIGDNWASLGFIGAHWRLIGDDWGELGSIGDMGLIGAHWGLLGIIRDNYVGFIGDQLG